MKITGNIFGITLKSIISRIINAGTPGLDENEKQAVISINFTSAVTGLMVFVFGGIIYAMMPLTKILIPVIFEGSSFFAVVYLNGLGKYQQARMGVYLIHCFSAVYFGAILGETIPVELIAAFLFIFLIGSACLVYREKKSRAVFISATIILWLIVYLNHFFQVITPIHFSETALPVISHLCCGGMVILMSIITFSYIKQNDKLFADVEKANTHKTNFLWETSHEIRTPLNGIIGIAQILQSRKSLFLQLEEGSEIMKEIDDLNVAGKTTIDIINNVLDLAKIQAGKFDEIRKTSFDIKDLIQTCISVNSIIARRVGADIILIADEEIPIMRGDEIFLLKIINNLLSNAIKFTAPKSQVRFTLEYTHEGYIVMHFRNSSFLSEEKAAQIFDEYQCERNAFVEGTGLGLYITKKLVTMLGGEISVETEREHTTFSVMIPFEPGDYIPSKDEIHDRENVAGKKILVIEDDLMSQMILAKFLLNEHAEVKSCGSVEEGLEILKEYVPDVIISDRHLPKMSGKELIVWLKDHFIDIPVIIASGDCSKNAMDEMEQVGAAAYIIKPIQHKNLYKILNQCLKKDISLS
ncbi:His Kinase A (phospho-acceptor) domain-containing protein [Chitinophaga sp. CF118]|uniref:ATP-binding response regulator n=1 Tax=Chitinophaga sp. CF118 TaxID=1884367 RepID=UPI0008DF64EE|nr:response regulator [Chitinophaga sp. CF118]SFD79244.1 His Kinase A (phospho-acceptor) domain-containing protein [Chitinophaga sp. CF118]